MKKIKNIIGLNTTSFLLFSYTGDGKNNDDKIKNDLSELKLIGKVKTLTTTNFFAVDKFGEIQKVGIKEKNTVLFNESGNMIEWNSYDSDGNLNLKYNYKYDNQYNIIEQWNTYYSDSSLNYELTYKYDDYDVTGNWIKKTEFKNDIPQNIIERKIEYYKN